MPAVGRKPAERTYLSIREVLELLVSEFSDITISKIRFLESRGLIHPERTPSGYRKFFEADVERLRWILRQQRENFLPLKVIKGRLEQDGAPFGFAHEPSLFDSELPDNDLDGAIPSIAPTRPTAPSSGDISKLERAMARLTATEDAPVAETTIEGEAPVVPSGAPDESAPVRARARKATTSPKADLSGATFSAAELATTSGASGQLIGTLREFGLISGRLIGGVLSFDEDELEIARIADSFERYGIEPRHLATIKRAAERQSELFGQVVAPLLRQRNPSAREQARENLTDLSALGTSLQGAFVRAALREATGL